jgi:hypothetical protein
MSAICISARSLNSIVVPALLHRARAFRLVALEEPRELAVGAAARSVRMRPKSTLAGSSLGSCGTSSPWNALARTA